jgi:hypothetical protein
MLQGVASGKLITALMVCEQKIFKGSSLYEELASNK